MYVEVVKATPLSIAFTITVVPLVPVWAVRGNVAEVNPAGIVTDAGTVAAVVKLESVTTEPPTGAAVGIVTNPLAVVPAETIGGNVTLVKARGTLIVKAPLAEKRLAVAVITAPDEAVIFEPDDTANATLELPAPTVTDAGTVTANVLLVSATTKPPDGAAPVKVTKPVVPPPLGMKTGLNVTVAGPTPWLAVKASFTVELADIGTTS